MTLDGHIKSVCEAMRRSSCAKALEFIPEVNWSLSFCIFATKNNKTPNTSKLSAPPCGNYQRTQSPLPMQELSLSRGFLNDSFIAGKDLDLGHRCIVHIIRENLNSSRPCSTNRL